MGMVTCGRINFISSTPCFASMVTIIANGNMAGEGTVVPPR